MSTPSPRCAVLLCTYPNSGTTWLQDMFSVATDLHAESIYPEGLATGWGTTFHAARSNRSLHARASPTGRQGSCSFIKSHSSDLDATRRLTSRFAVTGIVALVRDPLSNAGANWRFFMKQRARPAPAARHRPVLQCNATEPELQPRFTAYWDAWHCALQATVAALHIPLLRVQYEAMLVQPAAELRKVLTFGGYRIDESRVASAITNQRETPPHDLGLLARSTALRAAPSEEVCTHAATSMASLAAAPCQPFCASCPHGCSWRGTTPLILPVCKAVATVPSTARHSKREKTVR